jgi:signal transduction histidine kinase
MKERAAAMEGTFEMRRGKTGGTTIKIIIPFNKISSYENSDL